MLVPYKFVIPSNDDNWPDEEMCGYQLGGAVANIRYNGAHKDHTDDLRSIGFEFNKKPNNLRFDDMKRRMI
jgi:hypothetical protein